VPFRNWKIDDTEAIAIVRFGPFSERTTFDHYAVFGGDEPIIVVPGSFTVSIPSGWTFGPSSSSSSLAAGPQVCRVHDRNPRVRL
jgi:hypothetical protein